MSDDGKNLDDPVSVWIGQLRNADEHAARGLWNHFFQRLFDSVRRKIHPNVRTLYDEEDAAQSAFHSLCAGIAVGRFPDLNDRDDLWRLLLVITSRKISRRHEFEYRQRRDIRRNLQNHVFTSDPGADLANEPLKRLVSQEPTPEFAAEFAETCETMFAALDDPKLNNIVTLRMQGFNDSEIAERSNCSRRSVQRSLEVIRRNWKRLEGQNE